MRGSKALLGVQIYDGARRPLTKPVDQILVTLRNGYQKVLHRRSHASPEIDFSVPFRNSYKQQQAGEANLQFTFYEQAPGVSERVLELDMDYFKDKAAHLLLEVVPHKVAKVPGMGFLEKRTEPETDLLAALDRGPQ